MSSTIHSIFFFWVELIPFLSFTIFFFFFSFLSRNSLFLSFFLFFFFSFFLFIQHRQPNLFHLCFVSVTFVISLLHMLTLLYPMSLTQHLLHTFLFNSSLFLPLALSISSSQCDVLGKMPEAFWKRSSLLSICWRLFCQWIHCKVYINAVIECCICTH